MSALCAVPGGIHHSVVVVRDLEASLRFYRNGLGMDLVDVAQHVHRFTGAALRRVHAAHRSPQDTCFTPLTQLLHPAGTRPDSTGGLVQSGSCTR